MAVFLQERLLVLRCQHLGPYFHCCRLRNELELLLKANNENILRVYGWSIWPNSMGLIMQYMPGGNLRRLLMDTRIPLFFNLRLRMSSEIASGIAFLHNFNEKLRLTHGDLKPDNILLTDDLHCKIADFGGARLMKHTTSTTTGTTLSRAQMTVVYAAPERLRGRCRPKKEHDTYSFGIIIHGILSRESPLEVFSDEIDYVDAVKRGERPDTETIENLKKDQASEESDLTIIDCLESTMTRCWQQDPCSRPNMLVIRDELANLLSQQLLKNIQQSVSESLSKMSLFLPSDQQDACVPLSCFNAGIGVFNDGKRCFGVRVLLLFNRAKFRDLINAVGCISLNQL